MSKNDYLFMKPLWRRVALLVVCLVWAAIEWWGGTSFWRGLATVVTAYTVWRYFLHFNPPEDLNEPDA